MDGQALSKTLRTGGGLYLYCLIAAFASFVAVPLAVPETWAAWRRLRR